MSLYCVPWNNLKKTNHKHISLTRFHYCNSKYSKNIEFEKNISLYFFKISENFQKPKFKGRISDGLRVSFDTSFYVITKCSFYSGAN